ncbi:phosphoribosyltransferase [Candidatus Bathyarchaeota archaeon]|nr:MAG: phosphoribosyltransferase [Candidatus Bathyarchaeota archaeon]
MSLDVEFEIPTWDEIYEMLLRLAEKIQRDNFHPDLIIGVCRGGWPPARVISDLLGNPKLANISVEFYVDVAETKNKPVLTQSVTAPVKGKKVLILDDVADTGKTLKLVKKHLLDRGAEEVKIATIYYKPWSIVVPDYYEKETKRWIVFPWERKETVRNLMRKHRKEDVREKLIAEGMDPKLVERFINEVLQEKRP